VASVSNITALAGRPKLLFLDCCRGSGASPGSVLLPAKSQHGGQPGPRQLQPPARPSKQDIFIGFSTVPGFVSFTASSGSPYLQTLCALLAAHHATSHLADIHLLVKRKLAGTSLPGGATQGAEERSSLLCKLAFHAYGGSHAPSLTEHPGQALGTGAGERVGLVKQTPAVSSGIGRPARSAMYDLSSPRSFSPNPPVQLEQLELEQTNSTNLHIVQIESSNVEQGLQHLLSKVMELYGGSGKVKEKVVNHKVCHKFEYIGPEKAAGLLQSALKSVQKLKSQSSLWKFTQKIEISQV